MNKRTHFNNKCFLLVWWIFKGSVGLIFVKASVMGVTIPIDLSTRSFILIPHYFNFRRPAPLLNPSVVISFYNDLSEWHMMCDHADNFIGLLCIIVLVWHFFPYSRTFLFCCNKIISQTSRLLNSTLSLGVLVPQRNPVYVRRVDLSALDLSFFITPTLLYTYSL
jgi:hypothetical protein